MNAKPNLHQQASDRTRQKILDAARTLFIQQGFSATSMGALAKAAGINQSLVYHYFENKEDLWRHVKKEFISSFVQEDELQGAPPIETVDELIEQLINQRFKIHAKNPELMRMLLWQALEEEGVNLGGTSSKWLTSWLEAVETLQKKKIIRSTLSPKEILMLFNGIIWAPFFTPSHSEKDAQLFIQKMIKELKKLLA